MTSHPCYFNFIICYLFVTKNMLRFECSSDVTYFVFCKIVSWYYLRSNISRRYLFQCFFLENFIRKGRENRKQLKSSTRGDKENVSQVRVSFSHQTWYSRAENCLFLIFLRLNNILMHILLPKKKNKTCIEGKTFFIILFM